MLLTAAQLQEISRIIQDRHTAFIINTIGPDAVAPEVLERLKELGIVDAKVESIKDAYLYGQVVASAVPGAKSMTYDEFKAHIRKNPIPLTEIETQAVSFAQQHAAQYCRGLGNKVDIATGNVMIEADADLRAQMRDTIRTTVQEGIAKRKANKQVKSDLGWATKDWTRDYERIVNTENQFAMQQGVKDHIAKRAGPDARVAIRVQPDRCPKCASLFEKGGQPIIFKLADLEANGTNVGLKQADWQPVVPPVHPHCQCQLIHVPPGYGFVEVEEAEKKKKEKMEEPWPVEAEGYQRIRMVPGGKRQEMGKSEVYWKLKREDDLRKAFKIAKRVEYQGIPIAIENPAGTTRHWKADGEQGSTKMLYAYGYVVGTEGADTDGVDVFVGPHPKAPTAYVIHQQNPKTGTYDEDKVMLGFENEREALAAYQIHYDRPDFAAMMSPMPIDHFKRWVAGTAPKPYGLKKSETALVVTLEKLEKANVRSAGTIRGNEAAAEGIAHAMPDRSHGSGTGLNIALDNRPTHRPGPVDLAPTGDPHRPDKMPYTDAAVKRDLSVYEVQEPAKPRVHKLVISKEHHSTVLGEADLNRGKVERLAKQNDPPAENTVEPKTKKRKKPKREKAKLKDEESGETLH